MYLYQFAEAGVRWPVDTLKATLADREEELRQKEAGMVSRRTAALYSLMVPLAAPAWAKPCAVPHILFVCPAGSVKSAIAREEFKRVAQKRGISVLAESRGIHAENHISAQLAERLKRDGIDPMAQPLRTFSPDDAATADVVIAFDEATKAPGMEKARAWQVASWNSQYDKAKSGTLENIDRLLSELKRRPC